MQQRITSITAAQRAQFPAFVEKRIAQGLSTAPADRALVESGIARCYALAKLPAPKTIVWVKSPLVAAFSAPIAAAVIRLARDGLLQSDDKSAVRSVRSAVGSAVGSAVDSAVRSWWWYSYFGGRWWAGYEAYIRALIDVCEWDAPQSARDAIDAYGDAQSAGWWFPFEDFAIVCDAPTKLALDEQGRLHCDDGPAIQWGNEYALWFVNGTHVTQRIVEQSAELTAAEVSDERNAEVRRVMLDRYGGERGGDAIGKWLLDIDARPIDVDECHGSLYRAELFDDEPLQMLRVRCPSTARTYFLRVPPQMRTAMEARAWTFGMTAKEFAPAVES